MPHAKARERQGLVESNGPPAVRMLDDGHVGEREDESKSTATLMMAASWE